MLYGLIGLVVVTVVVLLIIKDYRERNTNNKLSMDWSTLETAPLERILNAGTFNYRLGGRPDNVALEGDKSMRGGHVMGTITLNDRRAINAILTQRQRRTK